MYPHLGDAEIGLVVEALDRGLADLDPGVRLAS
jgi:hypothetical protein